MMMRIVSKCASRLCVGLIVLLCQAPLMAASIQTASEIVDHVIWKNIPITIVLPVGVERRIDFPTAVRIEWPDTVGDKTSLQIRENGSLYWTAAEPFSRQRVNVFSMAGPDSWLLDVEARADASPRTLVILDDRFNDAADVGVSEPQPLSDADRYRHDGVDMVRFAAQNLYAPSRLITPLAGVVRVPVTTQEVPLHRGGALRTTPITQWKSSTIPPLYVTAVRVTATATATQPTTLDPRNLRGEWLSATPQHGQVGMAGDQDDTTVWYLVSSRPFEESIQ